MNNEAIFNGLFQLISVQARSQAKSSGGTNKIVGGIIKKSILMLFLIY
jgi:hypothetical protein